MRGGKETRGDISTPPPTHKRRGKEEKKCQNSILPPAKIPLSLSSLSNVSDRPPEKRHASEKGVRAECRILTKCSSTQYTNAQIPPTFCSLGKDKNLTLFSFFHFDLRSPSFLSGSEIPSFKKSFSAFEFFFHLQAKREREREHSVPIELAPTSHSFPQKV